MSDKELIEKIEDAYRRVRKIGPDAIYETELREVLRAAADALAAPVLPSSGVDEDALAEVIEAEIDKLRHETRLYPDIYKAEVARAVAEWLKDGAR